jgi:hypothetical protein
MPKPRKHARKRALKKKLTITMSPEARRKAEALAKKQCRSLSSLFEFLISLEHQRIKSEKKPHDPRTDSGIYRLGGSMVTP